MKIIGLQNKNCISNTRQVSHVNQLQHVRCLIFPNYLCLLDKHTCSHPPKLSYLPTTKKIIGSKIKLSIKEKNFIDNIFFFKKVNLDHNFSYIFKTL